jgi:hypothetical protein
VKELFTDQNKRIAIYDDVFELQTRQNIYLASLTSNFIIGWADGVILENQANRFLHAPWVQEDLGKSGIIEAISRGPLADEIKGYIHTGTVLNLSTPVDSFYHHAHSESRIFLYYVNLEWLDGWHGETLFYDEACKNIFYASPFTPNRVIVFDGSIPHSLRPPSLLATKFRFTLALIYNKA